MTGNYFIAACLLSLCILAMMRCKSTQSVDDYGAAPRAERAFETGMERRNTGNRSRAIVSFRKAIEYDSSFAKAWYHLAEMLDKTGQPESMMRALDRYLELSDESSDAAYLKLAQTAFDLKYFHRSLDYTGEVNEDNLSNSQRKQWKRLKRNSGFALNALRDSASIVPERMPGAINTDEHDEYWPVLLPDKSAFYFTRRIGDNEEFFVSNRRGDSLLPARPLHQLNTSRNEGAMTLPPSGNWMVFTWCNTPEGWGRCDLYITFRRDSAWSDPINLGPEVNSGGWESGPTLGTGGKALYFASTRAGGKGGSDIYRAMRKKDGLWGTPVNLGDSINTPGREMTPFLHPDGQTLYFRSNGWPGMGGYDLFVAHRKEDGSWTRPVNLGYPINTKKDEGSLFVGLDGKTAYYATDGFKSERTFSSSVDIYTFELPQRVRAIPSTYVRLHAVDAQTDEPIPVTLKMIDLQSRDTVYWGRQAAGEDNIFCVPAYHTYAVHVTSPGYIFHSRHIALDTVRSAFEPIRDTLFMQKVDTLTDTSMYQPTILENVFFEYDKSRLLPESKVELDQLVRFLREHPDLHITIRGHTDDIGSQVYNRELSRERARAVLDYLVQSGIEENRMKYKGLGEKEPIADNDTAEGRSHNRRTDFVIRPR